MHTPRGTFSEVLSQAIDDLLANGFDQIERVERWTRELRLAAERSLASSAQVEERVRRALVAIYQRLVDRGRIMRDHRGVSRFTKARVAPRLRSELDRRIMASANLIKLNRAQAIDETLQRFQGWSTSLPRGGTTLESKREIKAKIGKSLRSLSFEERRVRIDQGHKLVASLSEILATDGGAIAAIWRSHWRQPGYDYREDHKERDRKIYLVRNSWAHRAGLVKPGSPGYLDEVTQPGQEVFCRCYATWLYNLRDLPGDMLTNRGRGALSAAVETEALRRSQARADSVGVSGDALDDAIRLDRQALGYLAGLKRIERVPDRSAWHSSYDPDGDRIVLEAKFGREPPDAQVHMLLHEAGHRGQGVDRPTYERFKREHLNRLSDFEAMANPAHLAEFARTGEVEGGIAAEAFAESYARFVLGMEIPAELLAFWEARIGGRSAKMSKAAAEYVGSLGMRPIGMRCGACSMFRHSMSCTEVAGLIDSAGYCRLFASKQAAA